MLVLSRHVGETIQIGEEVLIRVVEIRGDRVRIGVEAPKSVAVHRGEVYRKILRTGVDTKRQQFEARGDL